MKKWGVNICHRDLLGGKADTNLLIDRLDRAYVVLKKKFLLTNEIVNKVRCLKGT